MLLTRPIAHSEVVRPGGLKTISRGDKGVVRREVKDGPGAK